MSDVVIRARDLRKVYRLYPTPRHRFLDMFGILRRREGAFTEHAALDGISLEIRRGEKVAFIGRNGAGKSTLLKLITHVIDPTSGTLEVSGKAHALLQIGSGFHPDFTGRENVYAYLAQLGVTGKEAERKFLEIVDFAELEEYIGQPVKTYSSGMAVRLMFATSTAITPDLLVLDEVLGVGDAYFAQKSYGRIRELCERKGVTLLLVTHDIYSASNICERLIWIDRGCVMMDGDGSSVVTAYEDSVRQQEENRLRVRKQQRLEEIAKVDGPSSTAGRALLVELYAHENHPQPSPVYFSGIELFHGERMIASIALDGSVKSEGGSHLNQDGMSWSEPLQWQGRPARALMNYGSPFHKVGVVFDTTEVATVLPASSLRVTYWFDEPCHVHGRTFLKDRETYLGKLPVTTGQWVTATMPLQGADATDHAVGGVNISGRHGTGAITVLDVKALDEEGRETYQFVHGRPASILIHYAINDLALREHAQVLLAFHRDGVVDVAHMIARDLLFDAAQSASGHVRVHLPRLLLGNGTFTVTVMIAREGYYDREQTKYFSLNPEVYTCLSRVIEIVVSGGGIVAIGTGVVAEGQWHLEPALPAHDAAS